MVGQPSNTLKGKIKNVVHAPPYQIVTIAIDPKSTPEITVAYIPVPGGPTFITPAQPPTYVVLETAMGGAPTGDGGNGQNGDVTVTIPVPNAVISTTN